MSQAQRLAANTALKLGAWSIYIGTCNLQISDGLDVLLRNNLFQV